MKQSSQKRTHILYQIAKNVAIVTAIFNLILSILLVANYIQTKAYNPINSPALEKLITRLHQNPNDDALREEVRALDLLARKAYFTRQWQIRTGGFILFSGILLLIISLKYMNSFRRDLPDLSKQRIESGWESKFMARKFLIGVYLSILLIGVLAIFLSQNELQETLTSAANGNETAADASSVSDELFQKNWPGFRGYRGSGKANFDDVPTKWDGATGENIVWKIELPKPGFNSPIYWNDRIFLTGADNDARVVYCFAFADGKLLWQHVVDGIDGSPPQPPKVTDDTGLAAPTMTTDGRRVFAIFATGDVLGLDFEGTRLWARNLGVPENHYGHSSSLLMYGKLLLVQYDHFSGSSLIALDAATGVTVWQTRRNVQISWASPILIKTEKRDEVVLSATPLVAGYDPKTGAELWQVDCMSGEIGSSPAFADGIVYAGNEYATLAAIQPGNTAQIVWEFDDELPDASSPLATEEYLIIASSYGIVTCLNAKTGDFIWDHEFDEGFYSSPILVGDVVYLMDMEGVMHIFNAAETFELIGSPALGESSVCIPAFADGRIFVRGKKHLYCIGKSND